MRTLAVESLNLNLCGFQGLTKVNITFAGLLERKNFEKKIKFLGTTI